MSDLHTSLLNDNVSFDQLYENVKAQLIDYQQSVDELQVSGESEIDQHNVNQVFLQLKAIQLEHMNIKENIIKLEQSSRGVDQRNKTKKLRDLYNSHLQRHQQLYKNMINDCGYESLKEVLKDIERMMKMTSKQDVQNFTLNHSSNNQKNAQNNSQLQMMDVQQFEQFDHLEWHNEIIKQNQEEIDQIQYKTQTINKIVQDLALEIEHQDTYFDVIETNVTTTKENVIKTQDQLTKTQEQQKSGKKKLWCMLICAVVAFLVLLLILLL
ncbi:unnamed protein product (macronuclear) [Paramecium tetraurelia]|uniref:Chromosome undetermined scaffold_64, whole genome shotgun sequence n=1 Tax=Paramecium tetraurelia TaxID=5888 RepID=Q3M101_PARTE|nr:uncharacterized protein GSPATT00020451001 [Paramecium tetraurelia]CAH69621.1 syntaxin 9-2 [Paramecium tetraurelia]CAK86779.1 unnamed protein product [Paramecium tetraurelia]|eukprot:XP_001454176.1 hypothetical protein (macronuclear) [Paramecium tetraurelia strain d4-2]